MCSLQVLDPHQTSGYHDSEPEMGKEDCRKAVMSYGAVAGMLQSDKGEKKEERREMRDEDGGIRKEGGGMRMEE
jgi:hypothetical protein